MEQRYQAVLAVIGDGETVTELAAGLGVRRQTVHEWLARYEAGGLDASELDEWVRYYNTQRPHQAIGMTVPAERFEQRPVGATQESLPLRLPALVADRAGEDWVARRAGANGVVSVSWQQVCLGQAAAGRNIDVHVGQQVLQYYDGAELLRTVARENPGPVCKRRASIPGARSSLKKGVRDQPK